MRILQLTVHFPPNVGGVETHLSDLVKLLSKKEWKIVVLCYRPLSTKVGWKMYEYHNNLEIVRLPWFTGLWYRFVSYPLLEFLYLFPMFFFFTPVIILIKNPIIIHAHGLIAATSAVFWGKIFRKRVIISTHNIYSFPKYGLYRSFAKAVFNNAKRNLCLSKKSFEELKALGIDNASIFTYWIDLRKFKMIENAKQKLGWKNEFTVLFVGRLIPEKGIDLLLKSIKTWKKEIKLVFVGVGPLEKLLISEAAKNSKIRFLGKVDQDNLPIIYSAADILIVPSISEEGFGRVIMEALACSTPVIASNLGAIPEAMDDTVGRLIDINPQNIKNTVEDFYMHPTKLAILSKNAREFALKRYSEKNGDTIIQSYSD